MASIDVRCTSCGAKMQLCIDLPEGFCPACGDKVSLDDAKKHKFSDCFLNNASDDDLWDVAKEMCSEDENDEAFPLLEILKDHNHPDGMCLYASICLLRNPSPSDIVELLQLYDRSGRMGSAIYGNLEETGVMAPVRECANEYLRGIERDEERRRQEQRDLIEAAKRRVKERNSPVCYSYSGGYCSHGALNPIDMARCPYDNGKGEGRCDHFRG